MHHHLARRIRGALVLAVVAVLALLPKVWKALRAMPRYNPDMAKQVPMLADASSASDDALTGYDHDESVDD